jgi:hypothetical protein
MKRTSDPLACADLKWIDVRDGAGGIAKEDADATEPERCQRERRRVFADAVNYAPMISVGTCYKKP